MGKNAAQIEALINQMGLGDTNKFQTTLADFVAESLETDLRLKLDQSGLKKRTGNLYNNLRVTYDPTTQEVDVYMEAYGLFQSYGVRGQISDPGAQPVDKSVLIKPKSGTTYAYGKQWKVAGGNLPYGARVKILQYGLRPKSWIPTDKQLDQIVNEIVDQFQELNKE